MTTLSSAQRKQTLTIISGSQVRRGKQHAELASQSTAEVLLITPTSARPSVSCWWTHSLPHLRNAQGCAERPCTSHTVLPRKNPGEHIREHARNPEPLTYAATTKETTAVLTAAGASAGTVTGRQVLQDDLTEMCHRNTARRHNSCPVIPDRRECRQPRGPPSLVS